MIRRRLSRYWTQARTELRTAFREKHTPHEVAASFAIGVFITALPSLGIGVGLFFVLLYLWTWVSRAALFASLAVLNPFVKPAVYFASYNVGAFLLGTEPVDLFETAALNSALTILKHLVLGNLLVAAVLSLAGYAVVYELTRAYQNGTVSIFGAFSRR